MRTGGFAPSGGDIISDRRYYCDDRFRFAAVGVSPTAGQNDSGKCGSMTGPDYSPTASRL